MEFIVTNEILELFKGKRVTVQNVKKLIPNYRDYVKFFEVRENLWSKELTDVASRLYSFLSGDVQSTKQDYINNISEILSNVPDDTLISFDGSNIYDGDYITLSEIRVLKKQENDKLTLDRLASDIRKAISAEKAKQTEDDLLKGLLTPEFLAKIAANEEIMNSLNILHKK
jgi:hypothetical protein